MAKKYSHKTVEKGKYDFWLQKGYFNAGDKTKKPFSIVLPPPNITGKLHLGHAWDTTLQDLIIRYKKLSGYDTLWLAGMDHAGIATQIKVEEKLRTTKSILRHDLGREKFIQQVWEWKDEYSNTIKQQWAKLGLSLDYSKERFTLEDNFNDAVIKTFVQLYNEGLIYRGKKLISWDPLQKTALSNIEVIYKETKGKMYYFKYFLENDQENYIEIATTRPETMFADQCVVVNPNDKRYVKYIGKKVINPSNNQAIEIIADEYVDQNFATGAMKCTPGHDFNDFIIGEKHQLDLVVCMDENALMNKIALKYHKQDRFTARKNLVNDLQKNNLVIKIEDIVHQVGYSERSHVIVEPYLSEQWFVKMPPLAQLVIEQQNNNSHKQVNFFPLRFNKTLLTWMENVQDWCISRQLWWGHRIPAWYHKVTKEVYVGLTAPENEQDWIQDEDVLDTWFSSTLWAHVGLGFNDNEEMFNRYFPSDVLVTGYDIIFFWVSRMMFQSLKFTKQIPFKNVLIHGLIRDEQGNKMSKSLGNGIDPMEVIEEYGADALRFFLVTNSSPGQDLRYSNEKLKASWNFINKLWNASRYAFMNVEDKTYLDFSLTQVDIEQLYNNEVNSIDCWIINHLRQTVINVQKNMNNFEFVLAGKYLYDFVWDKFCSWYIEIVKVNLTNDDERVCLVSQKTLFYVLRQILIMLHPFIPFVTEQIYQQFDLKKSIILEVYPNIKTGFEANKIEHIDHMVNIVTCLREQRAKHNIKKEIALQFVINTTTSHIKLMFESNLTNINNYFMKLTNSYIAGINNNQEISDQSIKPIIIPFNNYSVEIFVNLQIDIAQEILNLKQQLVLIKKEIARSESILNNEQFIQRASTEKINQEQEKYHAYKEKYQIVLDKLTQLEVDKN